MLGGAAIAQTKSPSSTDAMKMSQAECAALWNRVDSDKAGNLSESRAKAYVTDFKALDTNGDKEVVTIGVPSRLRQGLGAQHGLDRCRHWQHGSRWQHRPGRDQSHAKEVVGRP